MKSIEADSNFLEISLATGKAASPGKSEVFKKIRACVNPIWQTSHLWGLSPVCVLLCISREFFWLKAWEQVSHLKGLSPVWMRSCRTNWLCFLNSLGQNRQGCSALLCLLPLFKILVKPSWFRPLFLLFFDPKRWNRYELFGNSGERIR